MKNTLKLLLFSLFFTVTAVKGFSQNITAADRKKLQLKEDTLKVWSFYMIVDSMSENRMYADSNFTRVLVRTLQIRNSFYYPFDSVLGISKLYSPDSSFRIFTWNLKFDDYWSRQKGAIQMRTTDGSLKLIPLIDASEFTDKPEDSVRNNRNWIGAVYYNIVKNQFNGKSYYTLFGLDMNSEMSTKKWVEVLYFNAKNEPVFGGPFFSYVNDSIPGPPKYRISLEYKKDARVLANFIPEMQLILVDHLISETNTPENPWTFVPDGDSEGYKWDGGKWVHIDKVFTYKLRDGQAPVGDPLLDAKGQRDEKKLQEKTDKNKTKENNRVINYDN